MAIIVNGDVITFNDDGGWQKGPIVHITQLVADIISYIHQISVEDYIPVLHLYTGWLTRFVALNGSPFHRESFLGIWIPLAPNRSLTTGW